MAHESNPAALGVGVGDQKPGPTWRGVSSPLQDLCSTRETQLRRALPPPPRPAPRPPGQHLSYLNMPREALGMLSKCRFWSADVHRAGGSACLISPRVMLMLLAQDHAWSGPSGGCLRSEKVNLTSGAEPPPGLSGWGCKPPGPEWPLMGSWIPPLRMPVSRGSSPCLVLQRLAPEQRRVPEGPRKVISLQPGGCK